jgi:hypothetical protein
MTLTDTQLLLLSSASQREDLLLTPPEKLKGGAAKTVVAKLLAGGLVEEVAVERGAPHWRTGDDDQPLGLRITRAGLQAIGVEQEGEDTSAQPHVEPAASSDPTKAGRAPRDGSKRAKVIALLQRDEGATLDELVEVTGWLPHTTRAALTGLRQNGHAITRGKDDGGRSVYRIAPAVPETSTTQAPADQQDGEVVHAQG